jgi:[acyl-carrier-protein] S-malonyltransferase
MNLSSEQCSFLFPGQGSQSVGMGAALAKTYSIADETFLEADQILGFPLSQLTWEGPEEQLNDTVNTQPALFVHSIAALRVFQELNPAFQPAFVAGHSMGELSALVAAGSLEFHTGLHLVRTRGELMKQAGDISPGGMAAILGLQIDEIETICIEASNDLEVVQVANDNCPGQAVISGASEALERAMALAQESGARRVVRLAISIAAHSPLMDHAQDAFNSAVGSVPLTNPSIPIIGNVTAQPLNSASLIRKDLQAQLNSQVCWTQSIQYMLSKGVTTFLEIGNKSVLIGLLKRIDRQAIGIPLGEPQDFNNLDAPQ